MKKILKEIFHNFLFAAVVMAYCAGYSLQQSEKQKIYHQAFNDGRYSVVLGALN